MTRKVDVEKDEVIIDGDGPHDAMYFIDEGIFELSTQD